jgi:predicted DsbA family dithiol-disulfide isomerase
VDAPFTIDLWSDVICPFCCLGERQLLTALEGFAHRDQTVLRLRAFELDPRAREHRHHTLDELVARKYGIAADQARAMHQRLESEAAALDMTWRLDLARPTNTFDAHRLIALAGDQGLGQPMAERLFAAYFAEGLLVSDHEVLTTLALEVGVADASAMLSSDDYTREVRADEADATELGFSGVPAFLIDRRFVVSGAQGVDVIANALDRAWARRQVA